MPVSTSKTSLKATLQSQQTRLKNKEKAAHAAEAAELKTKHKGKGKAPALRPTNPFTPTDKILLIGEGNFSFAHALVIDRPLSLEHLPPSNITATSYDSEEECYDKYPDARSMVDVLRERGAEVLFGVDGTRLEKCNVLKGRRFDRTVFNFPHAGITDQDRNILSNQMLILGFLRSVVGCLAEGSIPTPNLSRKQKKPTDDDDDDNVNDDVTDDAPSPSTAQGSRGTVLVTLRNVPPYTNWDVPRLAKTPPKPTSLGTPPNPNYKLLRSFVFHRKMWKGYEHRMTKGERAHGRGTTGEGGEDRTWEFCLKD
ncbi:hypothetical protein EDB19DRAFT_1890883 [Suillus lakei]|nr:hypothetical protein EDB19DRAFT_1890883 [Suillus lakei]